jgi:murein DD-endopeptidase MepM/ murein hydrolase activator NlpD
MYSPRAPFKLVWPVENVHINRGFHPPSDPAHEGIDLSGRRGYPIMAAHEGVVIYSGQDFHGYGKMILIEYNHEWATLYGHLDQISVRQGQLVTPGDLIGRMGATGHASGVHLHFELMHNRTPTDPLPFLMHPKKLTSASYAKRLHSETQAQHSQTQRAQ